MLGAGSGGTAIAGYLASVGHRVRLWNRSAARVAPLQESKTIVLRGALNLEGQVELVTTNLAEAATDAEVIFVVTTADAHRSLAQQLAPLLCDGQIVLLNPGRTGGALEVAETLKECGTKSYVYIAEAQSLVYACRSEHPSLVRIFGVKKQVPVAVFPGNDTGYVVEKVRTCFDCFQPASSVLETSFENIGAVFHPAVVLFNAAAIERGNLFYFYRDMGDRIASFLVSVDQERIMLGRRYGIELTTVTEWIKKSYPESSGEDLCSRMRSNPAYYEIASPKQLLSRYLTEDVPTGLVPFAAFGELAGLEMPLTRAMIRILSTLLDRDFMREGRTLRRLGLEGMNVEQVRFFVLEGRCPRE